MRILQVGLIAGSLAFGQAVHAQEVKLTALYSQPKNAEEFDKYYYGKHMPLVYAVKPLKRVEVARPRPGANGSPPPYYVVTELWFESAEALKAVADTSEWKAVVVDVPNFAPPGTV